MGGLKYSREKNAFDKGLELAKRHRAEVYIISETQDGPFHVYPGDPIEMVYEFPHSFYVNGVIFGLGSIYKCYVPVSAVAGPKGLDALPKFETPTPTILGGGFAVVMFPHDFRVGKFKRDTYNLAEFDCLVRNIPDYTLAIEVAQALENVQLEAWGDC